MNNFISNLSKFDSSGIAKAFTINTEGSNSNTIKVLRGNFSKAADKIEKIRLDFMKSRVLTVALQTGSAFKSGLVFVNYVSAICGRAKFSQAIAVFNMVSTAADVVVMPQTVYDMGKRVQAIYCAVQAKSIEFAVDHMFELTERVAKIMDTSAAIGWALLTFKVIGQQNLYWLMPLKGIKTGINIVLVARDIAHTAQIQKVQVAFKKATSMNPVLTAHLSAENVELSRQLMYLQKMEKPLDEKSSIYLSKVEERLKQIEVSLIEEEFKAKKNFMEILGSKKVKKYFDLDSEKTSSYFKAIEQITKKQLSRGEDPLARKQAIQNLNERLAWKKWSKLADTLLNVINVVGGILYLTPAAIASPYILVIAVALCAIKIGIDYYFDSRTNMQIPDHEASSIYSPIFENTDLEKVNSIVSSPKIV